MNKLISIRELKTNDLSAIKKIIDENQLFPSDYLDDMTAGFFNQAVEEFWFVAENSRNDVIGIAYCAPERMTNGTWNLLLIAVARSEQGGGIGSQLMAFVENKLAEQSARVLLVETSGLAEFELTRRFYPKVGYKQIAVIPEYYDKDDDKIVFYKSLI